MNKEQFIEKYKPSAVVSNNINSENYSRHHRFLNDLDQLLLTEREECAKIVENYLWSEIPNEINNTIRNK